MPEPRRINRPEPGHWLMRLTKGGPLVPARIFWCQTRFEPDNPTNLMERSPFLVAQIGGDIVTLAEVWERRGEPVDEAEYRFRAASASWAKQHAPHEPIANPKSKIDLSSLPPLYRRNSTDAR